VCVCVCGSSLCYQHLGGTWLPLSSRSKSLGSESVQVIGPGSHIWESHKVLMRSSSQEEQ